MEPDSRCHCSSFAGVVSSTGHDVLYCHINTSTDTSLYIYTAFVWCTDRQADGCCLFDCRSVKLFWGGGCEASSGHVGEVQVTAGTWQRRRYSSLCWGNLHDYHLSDNCETQTTTTSFKKMAKQFGILAIHTTVNKSIQNTQFGVYSTLFSCSFLIYITCLRMLTDAVAKRYPKSLL